MQIPFPPSELTLTDRETCIKQPAGVEDL